VRRIRRVHLREPKDGIACARVDWQLTQGRGEGARSRHCQPTEWYSVTRAEQNHSSHSPGLGAEQAKYRRSDRA